MKDYYQILGLPRSASVDEIKKAYRRLAKQHHPDVNKGNTEAEEKFKVISEAYNTLSDPEQKKKYDMFGQAGFAGGGPGPGGPGYGGFHWQQGGQPRQGGGQPDFNNMGDLGDLFSELFDMGGVRRRNYAQGTRGGESYQPAVKGHDTYADVEIAFDEAISGKEVKISVKRGDKVERLTVKVPPGVDNGSKVRIAGKGQPGFGGGKDGDLYLRVHVTPHPSFWREGADIYIEVPITIYDAVLGSTVEVPTTKNSAKMKIPAGTKGGQKFRISGKGAPVLGKKGKTGDQYVIVNIVSPKKLPSELKKEFERLKEEYPYDPNE